jgi:hypothetical protein
MKKVLLNIFSIITAAMFFVACSEENINPSSDLSDAGARKGKPATGAYGITSSLSGNTLTINVDQSATQAVSHMLLQVVDCEGNFVTIDNMVWSSLTTDLIGSTTGNGTGCAFNNTNPFIKFDGLDIFEKNGSFSISIEFNTQIQSANILVKSATNCFPFTLSFTNNCGVVPPSGNNETAFAFGGDNATCFLNMGFSRWGWSNGAVSEGTYEWPIYAAAGQCDLAKGTHVGTLHVNYSAGAATVSYEIFSGYSLEETHLYVGSTALPIAKNGKSTVAPGQYPNVGTASSYTVTGLSGNVYVVAHAVVGGF